MQNSFNHPHKSGELWLKRPYPSRVNDYDSDESSTTGSPWRAMKRLRVGEAQPQEPEQSQISPDLERVVSRTESISSTKDEDYASFNKMLGALHLERRNRGMVRTPARQHSSDSSAQQTLDANKTDSLLAMKKPDQGSKRHYQTKLRISSKLA